MNSENRWQEQRSIPHLTNRVCEVLRVTFRVPSRRRPATTTLLETARTPKHLGAAIGFLSVLHTWGQQLHPDSVAVR